MNEAYYLKRIDDELVIALGCTEPIAVAYAAALARKEAGTEPIERLTVRASVNIYKNSMGVTIPGTDAMGVAMAAALGAVGGKPALGLKVLDGLTQDHREMAQKLCEDEKVALEVSGNDPVLYVEVTVHTANHSGRAAIAHKHDLIVELERDGEIIFENDNRTTQDMSESITEDDICNIWEFTHSVDLSKLDKIVQAIDLNMAIADEGLARGYGLEVGRSISQQGETISEEAIPETWFDLDRPTRHPALKTLSLSDYCASRTASATDARMAGATFPAMSNSGSGNQGITVTVAVAAAAEYLGIERERHIRAQTLSHLIAIHAKQSFGRLSPLCGAMAAAIGASGGLVMLLDGDMRAVMAAAQNMFGSVTGMICDGAKAGCALKVSISIYSAVQSALVAIRGHEIKATDGVIEYDVEKTIRNMSRISHEGMSEMDKLLLNIMLNKDD